MINNQTGENKPFKYTDKKPDIQPVTLIRL
jgi:hypothetical protein